MISIVSIYRTGLVGIKLPKLLLNRLRNSFWETDDRNTTALHILGALQNGEAYQVQDRRRLKRQGQRPPAVEDDQ
jgi:hypothetical protein